MKKQLLLSLMGAVFYTLSSSALLAQGPLRITHIDGAPAQCDGGFPDTTALNVVAAGGTLPYSYKLNDGTPQPGNSFSGIPVGTAALVSVTDADNTTATFSLNNVGTSFLTYSMSVKPVSCTGASDGVISVTTTSGLFEGQPLFQIVAGPVTRPLQPSGVFSGLPAGTYTVSFVDQLGICDPVTMIVPLVENPIFIESTTTTSPTCAGRNDGRAEIQIVGGTPPYIACIAKVNGGNASQTCAVNNGLALFQGLAAGTYSLTVTDANNCSIMMPQIFTVATPNDIKLTVTTANACFNVPNGRITVLAEGATPPTTFTLSGPVTLENDTGVFTNLTPGVYQIAVTDSAVPANCVQSTATVGQAEPILFNYTVSSSNCETGGQITIFDVTGGLGAYEYKLDDADFAPFAPPTTIPTAQPFLTPGSHTLTLRSGGCSSQTLTFIVNPTVITFTPPTVVNETCFNGTTGSIELALDQITGGTAPYEFSIGTDAGFQPVPFKFEGLAAGVYVATVRDANGCIAQQPVSVTQPSEVIVNFTVTQPSCPGGNNGEISATATGGTGTGYSFSINGVDYTNTTGTFSDLIAGTYSLSARDSAQCLSRTQGILLPDPEQMGVFYKVTDSTCATGGSLSIEKVIGGLEPYEFSIDGGDFGNVGTPAPGTPIIIPDLAPGSHTLTIRDQKGCFSPTVDFVVNPTEITFNQPTVVQVTCFNGTNGSITLPIDQIFGGLPPYQYSIGTDAGFIGADQSFDTLSAGTYMVTVQDVNGCFSKPQAVVVHQPTEITFSFDVTDPIKCPGGTGTIAISNVQGGSGLGYQFSIDGGVTYQATGTFTDLRSGTYALTVRDSLECVSRTQELVLLDPQQMGLVYTTTPATCRNSCDGAINIQAVLDGTAPYTYSIDGSTFVTDPATLNPLCGGVHTVTIQDAFGCLSPTVKAVVEQPGPLEVTYKVTEVTYNAGSDGRIEILATGGLGKGPFGYSIDGVDYSNTTGIFENLVAGVYELTVQDQTAGCISPTIEIEVTEPVRTKIVGTTSIPATTPSKIPDGSLTILTDSTAPLLYSIQGVSGPFQQSPTFRGLEAGVYNLFVKPLVGAETPGVTIFSPVQIQPDGQGNGAYGIGIVQPVAPIAATVRVTPADCVTGQGGSIIVDATGGTRPYEYSLDNGPFQTSNVFTNVSGGTHLVTIRDANGHTTSINVTVPSVRGTTSNPIFDYLGKYCPACA